jgi:hypothetical protein
MTTLSHEPTADRPSRSYEADYYGWIEDQVALLKAGRLSEIDMQNIAEEIGSDARRQYDYLEDAARALIYNLLKWDLMPDRRSASAVLSMDAHRNQIAHVLTRNPSLAAEMSKALGRAYIYATYDVMRDSDLPNSIFAPECPYDWEAVRTREIVFETTKSPSGAANL